MEMKKGICLTETTTKLNVAREKTVLFSDAVITKLIVY